MQFAAYVTNPVTDIGETLKYLLDGDPIVRSNAINVLAASEIRSGDVDFVIKSLMEHLEREQHLGCRGDAELKISELKVTHAR